MIEFTKSIEKDELRSISKMAIRSVEKENEWKKLNEKSLPKRKLKALAKLWAMELFSEEFSKELDKKNILPTYRDHFYYPKLKELPIGIKRMSFT
jgi:hypothetical protein